MRAVSRRRGRRFVAPEVARIAPTAKDESVREEKGGERVTRGEIDHSLPRFTKIR